MAMSRGRSFACLVTALSFLGSTALQPALAGVISTRQALDLEQRDAAIADIQAMLASEEVQSALVALGVDADVAAERVAAMTAAELELLEQKMAELPAGAGVIEVVGVVFVVLMILELVGVTNIFNAF